jgi:hypothetical protein
MIGEIISRLYSSFSPLQSLMQIGAQAEDLYPSTKIVNGYKMKWIKDHGIIVSISFMLFLIFYVGLSNATLGYSIYTSTDGVSWSIDRYTENLTWNLDENIVGMGNFSRYNYVKPISDLSYVEKSSAARGGKLSLKEITNFKSKEGAVSVGYSLQSVVNNTDQNSTNNDTDRVKVSIYDAWPFYFTNQRTLLYEGHGIKTSEKYESSGDIISTYSNSWKLKKDSIFLTSNNKTLISIQLTPQGIIRDRHSNKKLTYLLDVQSQGNKESLDVLKTTPSDEKTSKFYDDNITRISQDYVGQINMKLKIVSNDTIPWLQENDSYNNSLDALPCCSDGLVLDPKVMKLVLPYGSTVACQSMPTANESVMKLIDHSMASEVNESMEIVGQRTDLFFASNDKVYSWLSLGRVSGDHNVEWKWFSPGGDLVNTSSKLISSSMNLTNESINIHSLFSPASYITGNTSGNWAVDILLDGRKILTEHFTLIHDIKRIPPSFIMT